MKFSQHQLDKLNDRFKGAPPVEIIVWAIRNSHNPVVTTNFRPYEVAILEAVTNVCKAIPVLWCDTGYNTPETYRHAQELTTLLGLNIKLYVPQQTAAYRNVTMGIPDIDDPLHAQFTNEVKLEPFRRAMKEHQPDLWFTNLRKGQTQHRDSLNILSLDKEGLLKVSPFYHWSDSQLDEYLRSKGLPNEFEYFDPTKVLANRECGLHV